MTKTNEKVTVPREVAEAIERIRRFDRTNYHILRYAEVIENTPIYKIIRDWAFEEDGSGSPDLLMQALVNGYEIEKTPEDRFREYYARIDMKRRDANLSANGFLVGTTNSEIIGIENTLAYLGIKIEGVNA